MLTRRLFLIVFLWPIATVGFAQKQDPKAMALLDRARSMSPAGAAGVPAYRLEASFETFDSKGQPDGAGTVVQTALPDGHLRRVVTFRGKTSDAVRFEGWHRVADEDYLETFMQKHLLDALLEPVPTPEVLAKRTVTPMPWKAGTAQLQCAVISVPVATEVDRHAFAPSNAYCMDDSGLMRTLIGQGYTVVLNSFRKLGTLLVPGDVSVMQGSVKRGQLKLTTFAAAPKLTPSSFELPTVGAGQVDPLRSTIGATIITGQIVKKVTPVYPIAAKQAHISGAVTLHAIIGRDGSIRDLEVITTPDPSLSESAVQAVRQWQYKPYLMNGSPVEVDTTITVNYSFGF